MKDVTLNFIMVFGIIRCDTESNIKKQSCSKSLVHRFPLSVIFFIPLLFLQNFNHNVYLFAFLCLCQSLMARFNHDIAQKAMQVAGDEFLSLLTLFDAIYLYIY